MELPYTVHLMKPLKHGDNEITELVFKRRAVLHDIRDIQLTELDRGDNITKLTARLTGNPPSVIQNLDMVDVGEVSDVVKSFFQRSQTTGNEPADS